MKRLILAILLMAYPAWALDIDLDSNDAVDVAFGGTNSTTASDARTALGLAIGTNVQAYDATILNDADIGVTVQAYDATLLKAADIGVTVQGYDAEIAAAAAGSGAAVSTFFGKDGDGVVGWILQSSIGGGTSITDGTATGQLTQWDGNSWEPIDQLADMTISGGTANSQAVWNASGDLAASEIEVDGAASQTLTVAECLNSVITNYGQGASDITLTGQAAAAGYNMLFVVGTAQAANDWKFRAAASDKIYAIAANGGITAGDDNGYFGFAAPAVGGSFACWTFKTGASTYDWICKCISGTCEATAP